MIWFYFRFVKGHGMRSHGAMRDLLSLYRTFYIWTRGVVDFLLHGRVSANPRPKVRINVFYHFSETHQLCNLIGVNEGDRVIQRPTIISLCNYSSYTLIFLFSFFLKKKVCSRSPSIVSPH